MCAREQVFTRISRFHLQKNLFVPYRISRRVYRKFSTGGCEFEKQCFIFSFIDVAVGYSLVLPLPHPPLPHPPSSSFCFRRLSSSCPLNCSLALWDCRLALLDCRLTLLDCRLTLLPVYCDWMRWQFCSATYISVWQHNVNLSLKLCPLDKVCNVHGSGGFDRRTPPPPPPPPSSIDKACILLGPWVAKIPTAPDKTRTLCPFTQCHVRTAADCLPNEERLYFS